MELFTEIDEGELARLLVDVCEVSNDGFELRLPLELNSLIGLWLAMIGR